MTYRWIPGVVSLVIAGAVLAIVVGWAQGVSARRAAGLDFGSEPVFDGAPGVVVAELFTSEGCSSCPPADLVLSQLIAGGAGKTVVLGLGEHVDYWNELGWRDAFSSGAFSVRQADYHNQVFRRSSIYTPQMVVDGQFEAVGSDRGEVRRALANALRTPKAPISVSAAPAGAGRLSVHVSLDVPPAVTFDQEAELVLALTQDRLVTDVSRGENRGRRLTHNGVVRSLTSVARLSPPARQLQSTATLRVEPGWNPADLKVVALLQERQRRRIVGAGWAKVAADGANGTNGE